MIIDTNFAWATQPEIIDGLTALKLDPRDIKYVSSAMPTAITIREPPSYSASPAPRSLWERRTGRPR